MFGSACSNVELLRDSSAFSILLMVITMTAGTGLIMWMGELITERGIGNGMSLLIFASIASSFPSSLNTVWSKSPETALLVVAIGVVIVGLVILVEQSQRRIPVQYAKRMVGRREYGGQSTYIPIKVNMAGVVPVIFASSLLYLPALIAQFDQPDATTGQVAPWVNFVSQYLTQGDHPLYMAMYFLLILGFTYFYVAITFNPQEVSDNMKQYGGFIPGIRAGRPTTEFLEYVLSRITLPGAIYLGLIALIPLVAFSLLGTSQNFPFGGTSILIIVGVGLESVKQINAQMQERNYEGLLK
jgi:preprotein translocase subunit SecY